MNLSTVKWAQWDKTQSRELLVCSYVCASHCAQLVHTILHRIDPIISLLPSRQSPLLRWCLFEGRGALVECWHLKVADVMDEQTLNWRLTNNETRNDWQVNIRQTAGTRWISGSQCHKQSDWRPSIECSLYKQGTFDNTQHKLAVNQSHTSRHNASLTATRHQHISTNLKWTLGTNETRTHQEMR